jgi:hypothetical protein
MDIFYSIHWGRIIFYQNLLLLADAKTTTNKLMARLGDYCKNPIFTEQISTKLPPV